MIRFTSISAIFVVLSLFSIAMLLAAIIYLGPTSYLSLLGALTAHLIALGCFGWCMFKNTHIHVAELTQKIWLTFYTRIFGQSLEDFLSYPVDHAINLKDKLECDLKNYAVRLVYVLVIIAFLVLNIIFFMIVFWPVAVILVLISFFIFIIRTYIKKIISQFDQKLEKYSSQRFYMLGILEASFNMWASLGNHQVLVGKLLDNNQAIAEIKFNKQQFLGQLLALKIVLPLLMLIILSVSLYLSELEIAKFWLIFLSLTALGHGLSWSYLINYYDFNFTKPSLKNLPPKQHHGHVMPVNITGQIEILAVSFSYHDSSVLVLNNMSLAIEAGGFYSLIGASGSGKSTLLKILMAQLVPSRGQVVFDGQDMRSLDLDSLRSNFGVVGQDSRLFAGSIYDNILCGRKINPRIIEDLLYSHEIFDCVLDIPMGLQAQVFLAAPNLSRSQILVILLARALVHGPKMLFLDEIFKGISQNEQRVIGGYLSSLTISRIIAVHQDLSYLQSHVIQL